MIDPRTVGVSKFGHNTDIDNGTPEDIWNQGGTYTFLSAAATLYVSSSSAADTAKTVTVIGLDADGVEQTVTATLNGQTQVALSGTWLRVYRAYNSGSTAFAGDIYIAETDDLTDGVPDTASKIKAKIDTAYGQTLMAITTVPAKVGTKTVRKAYIAGYNVTIESGTPAATSVEFTLNTRASGGVFLTKSTVSLNSDSTSFYTKTFDKYIEVAPLTDIKMRASVDKDGSHVDAEFTVFYEVE